MSSKFWVNSVSDMVVKLKYIQNKLMMVVLSTVLLVKMLVLSCLNVLFQSSQHLSAIGETRRYSTGTIRCYADDINSRLVR